VETVRVPGFPTRATAPISRLTQFRDGGYLLVSHCSADADHQHVIVYDTVIAAWGDAEVDYAFKVAMCCPECGAPGGGMSILSPASKGQ
jgi:hypothetical protein